MGKILLLKGCYQCWHMHWGTCQHPDMHGEICPNQGFVKNCPLSSEEEFYQGMKTEKYYEDNDW